MRRRSSEGSEDEARDRPHVSTGSSKKGRAEVMARESAQPVRATTRHMSAQQQQQQRKAATKEASVLLSEKAPWPRTTPIPNPPLEPGTLDEPVPSKSRAEYVADHLRKHAERRRSPWRCSFLTLATSIGAIVILLTVVHSFLNRQQDPKGCAMSYMRPRFDRFPDFDTEHTRFASKYSLYLYREGGVDEDIRVKGIPVLFIPGNAGSYKQVRPIAAEAAVYFHDVLRQDGDAQGEGKRPLDFFTVDFNEELIAFHGQTLLDQAEYLNEAIAYILALYHNPQRSAREPGLPDPKSVIMLGHSMGGVVARTMLRMPNYQENTINTILTLSAPHARPPISFDAAMVSTYNDINTYWRRSFSGSAAKNPLDDVTLVSVAGGGLDTMIPSEYTSLTSLVPDTHGFTVFTSSIPDVWTGMDHLAIMWCDQFRKALVKAIYDVIDVRRPSQTRPRPERIRAFRKRLLTGMEPVVEKGLLEQEPTTYLTLEHSSTGIMSHGERLVLRSLGDTGTTKAHVMPIPAQPFVEGSKFTLLTDQKLDSEEDDGTMSVLLCSVFPPPAGFSVLSYAINLDPSNSAGGSTRLACKNAVSDVSLLPASNKDSVNAFDGAHPFSYLQYELSSIADYQFIAVVEKAKERMPGWVIAEFSNAAESSTKVSKGHHQLLLSGATVRLPAKRPMMTELKIPEVHSTLFAYSLEVDRKPCRKHEESFAPLMRQYIAEPYESKYFVNTKGGNINVHGLSPYMPPRLSAGPVTEGLSLQFWTDPMCNSTVEISFKVDVLGSAGKLVMRYRTVFAAFPILVVALVLRKQFKVYDTTGVFISFTQSMDQCIRTSLPAIFIALTFFAIAVSKSSHNLWTRHWLSKSTGTSEQAIDFTVNDLMLGTSDPFFWFLVPLFAIICVGICIVMNYVVLVLTHTIALGVAKVLRWAQGPPEESRRAQLPNTGLLNRRNLTIAVLLLLVVTIIPYQFAYAVLCLVQAVTCIRAIKTAQESQTPQSYHFYNYAHSVLLLMLWILPINAPVLVVWIHNLTVHWLTPFSTHHNLLSVLGYILLVETMSTNNMIPRVTSRVRYFTNTLMFALALYAAVYGVTYAYRMHYLVNALCCWLFVIHLSNSGSLASLARQLSGSSSSVTPSTAPPTSGSTVPPVRGKKRP